MEGGLETPLKIKSYGEYFCKTSFQVGMGLREYRNKAEMKECKKTVRAVIARIYVSMYANVKVNIN